MNKQEEDCSNIDALHFETATIVVLVIVDPGLWFRPMLKHSLSFILSLFQRFFVYSSHEVKSLPTVHYALKRGYEILLRLIEGSNKFSRVQISRFHKVMEKGNYPM